ncbi:MAG: ABC transporter permease [Lachnospiraceae bacterium]|nr:ABC transporter permease [Lachnospiraceae bacterium]
MIHEYIADALRNIRNNRLRTALTMLGIVIGIASVIAVFTIGDGLTAYVQNEMGGFSSNMAMLHIDTSITNERFTPEDIRLLDENIPGLAGASFDLESEGILTGKRAAVDASYTAGNAVIKRYVSNKMKYGRYFTEDEVENHAPVCVIAARDAQKLCGTEDAVGQTVEFSLQGRSKTLTIIGVRENYSEAILTIMDAMSEYMALVELPYTVVADLTNMDMKSGVQEILLFGETGSDSNDLMRTSIRFWKNRHGVRDEKAVMSLSMADVSGEIDTIFAAIKAFMSFVAAISLVVGGIGVMNIMLVSVTERTREIGIRKSIGARTGAILVQFLAEAMIISFLGGIVGVTLGITVAAVACYLLKFELLVSPSVVVLATAFSTMIGLIFGLHPARKAAKMKPIDALHF